LLSEEKVKDILFKLNMLGFEEEYDEKKDNLKSHLKRRCDDAVKGVGRSRMLWMTFFFIFILSFMTITAASIGYAQVPYPPQPTNCGPPTTDSDGNTRQTCKEGMLETLPSGAQLLDQGDISCNITYHPLFCVKQRPDPPYCDRIGYPACYNVGYTDGKIAGLLDGSNGIFYLFASPEHDCLDQSVSWCNGWKDGYRAGFLTNCGDSYRGCQSVNNNNNTAFAQTPNQSQIQNQSQNSKNNTTL
jgi:hypothetical protein